MSGQRIPHMVVVVSVTFFVLFGFLGVSAYTLGWIDDGTTKGNIIGTWINFAMLAVGFWLGSSSGGKMRETKPTPVEVANTPDNPVPVETPERNDT